MNRPNPTPPSSAGAAASSSSVGADDGLPDPPTTFPELEKLSLAELKALHEEPAKFDAFVQKLEHQKQLGDVLQRKKTSVEKAEKEHMEITSRIDSVDENGLTELKQEIEEMEKDIQRLEKRKKEWEHNNSTPQMVEKLNVAMREANGRAEELTKGMLSNSIDFDTFLQEYFECRKKYHERKLKLQRLEVEQKQNAFMR